MAHSISSSQPTTLLPQSEMAVLQQQHHERQDTETALDFSLAEFLARSTSKSAVVFRRYDKLALRNILRLNEKLYRMELESHGSQKNAEQDARLAYTVKEYCENHDIYANVSYQY